MLVAIVGSPKMLPWPLPLRVGGTSRSEGGRVEQGPPCRLHALRTYWLFERCTTEAFTRTELLPLPTTDGCRLPRQVA